MIKQVSLKLSAVLLIALLLMASAFTAFAEQADENDDFETPQVGDVVDQDDTQEEDSAGYSRVSVIEQTYALTDDAGLFSEAEAATLQQRLDEAGKATGWQFIVHTSNDGVSSNDMTNHYDSYYNSQAFQKDAIMLVFDNASNNRIILTYGGVKDYFKGDAARYDDIKSAMKPYLNSGDNLNAALTFVDKAQAVYKMGKTNAFLLSLKKVGPFSGIAGVIIGVIFFFITKSRYKNMGKSGTYDLAANSKVDLQDVEDTFVTQHTTVRTIEKNNDSDSSPSSDGHSSGSF